jgi:hypothetical protein
MLLLWKMRSVKVITVSFSLIDTRFLIDKSRYGIAGAAREVKITACKIHFSVRINLHLMFLRR